MTFTQPRSTTTTANGKMKKKQMKKCCFCDENQAIVMIKKSFTTKPYCLFHYYTTKACRIDTSKVSLIESEASDEFKTQVQIQKTHVQEIFAEAFTELQKEISTEATRSFQSMVERGNDPLSILIDSCKQNRIKHPKENEGGFMRHIQNSKESKLMEQQLRRNELAARESVSSIHNNVNLSKRRKTSSKSSWHLVFDKKTDDNEKFHNNDSMSGLKCSCGSRDIILCGNITGRNDAVPKAEIWGLKRDNEVSSRFQCTNCSNIWNEDG